jgi:hypothetical protein
MRNMMSGKELKYEDGLARIDEIMVVAFQLWPPYVPKQFRIEVTPI